MHLAAVRVNFQSAAYIVSRPLVILSIQGRFSHGHCGAEIMLLILQQQPQLSQLRPAVAFGFIDLRQHQRRAWVAAVTGQQPMGGVQMALGLIETFLLEQHDAQLQMSLKIPRVVFQPLLHVADEGGVAVKFRQHRAGVLADAVTVTLASVGPVLLVDVDIQPRSPPRRPGSESAVEGVQAHIEGRAETGIVILELAVLMHQFQQPFEAELLGDELHHQIGLKIGEAEVGAALGAGEAGVETGHRQQPPVLHRPNQVKALLAAPVGAGLPLLPHRDALRQPTGDAVAGHLQGYHMDELMPDDLLPVGAEGVR